MSKCLFRPVLALFLAVVVLAVGGCTLIDAPAEPSGDLAIARFTASPTQVPAGGSTQLSWEVEGAESVEIDQGLGKVKDKDSSYVRPERTTKYTLTARNGTAVATKSLEVLVGTASPSPNPSPTPTPSPTPSPSPSPSPTPTPSPAAVSCGETVTKAGTCSVVVTRPVALPAGQCIALNVLTVSPDCPVGYNTSRALRFDINVQTTRPNLRWRRSTNSSDRLEPSAGVVASKGTTSVLVSDLVLHSEVTFEVVDGDDVLMSYTLRHY
jgi:hypothetical protein